MMTRRTFLHASSLAAAACAGRAVLPARPRLSVLILGGTGFLGPALVEAAAPRGHHVTLFNRGKTNPGLFPELEQLHGDRDGKLDALRGRRWDVVFDDSGYVPRIVRQSAELLRDAVGRYVFVSTISVYADDKTRGQTESGPRRTLPPEAKGSEDSRTFYGALKAGCEDVVAEVYGARALTVRPGLIVGPRDATDRFTYWPVRAARGGEILAPGDGNDPVEFIDVRDLAAWMVECAEAGTGGVYTAVGPATTLTMRELLAACQQGAGVPSTLTWASSAWLEAHEVGAWSDMPVWIPDNGLATLSAQAAIARGLRFRPLLDTVRDTLAWWQTVPAERRAAKMKAGLTPEREATLLAELHKKA
jgi:2'-hydroxyisoflavone reductase